jgi:hypothetical protein
VPYGAVFDLVVKPARQLIVPVRENVRLHPHAVSHGALHGEAPAIDLRLHVFDDDAASVWRG